MPQSMTMHPEIAVATRPGVRKVGLADVRDHRPLSPSYPTTPDGRYFVVRDRLWRCSNPALPPAERVELTRELMSARRAKGVAIRANDIPERNLARARVEKAKVALGERGPPWWTDGAADLNRRLVANTPYAAWWADLSDGLNRPDAVLGVLQQRERRAG